MVQVLVLVFLLLVVLDAVLVSYLLSQRSVAQPRTRLKGAITLGECIICTSPKKEPRRRTAHACHAP